LNGERLDEWIEDTDFDKPTPFKNCIQPYHDLKLNSLLKPITYYLSEGNNSSTSKTTTAATEALKAALRNTKEWKVVAELF